MLHLFLSSRWKCFLQGFRGLSSEVYSSVPLPSFPLPSFLLFKLLCHCVRWVPIVFANCGTHHWNKCIRHSDFLFKLSHLEQLLHFLFTVLLWIMHILYLSGSESGYWDHLTSSHSSSAEFYVPCRYDALSGLLGQAWWWWCGKSHVSCSRHKMLIRYLLAVFLW